MSGGGDQNDPGGGFVANVGAPLLRAVGLGISARGGMAGPFLASIGDSISNARDERIRRDVLSNTLPDLLAGVQRQREIKPGVPGKPEVPGQPAVAATATDFPSEPDPEAILPGTAESPATSTIPAVPAIPPTVRTWTSEPTMGEAIARLQQRGGPASTQSLAMQYLMKAGLPSMEQTPPETLKEIEQRNTMGLQQEAQATEEARRTPIYAGALEPNASAASRGAAAAAGMGGIHPPTQAEQLQMEAIKRQRELGTAAAQQARAEAATLGQGTLEPDQQGPPSPGPPQQFSAPTIPGMPPFSAFQPTLEQRRSRLLSAAAAAEAGDPKAIDEIRTLVGAPAANVRDFAQYGQAGHALRPPEVALSPERVKLIASGAITDPRVTQAAAKQMLATDEASAIRVAGAKAESTARGRDIATPQISSDALDLAAEGYLQTRQLPAMGMGGVAQRARILNRAAELAKERGIPLQDVAERQATFKAAQTELSQLQTQRGKTMAFADTADKNLDMALQLSARVPRTGIPQINSWLQTGQTKWTGDPALAAFAAATRVGINEVAKVTSGQISGTSTDTARKEIENMLNTAQTPDAFREVVETLRVDMANRKAGFMRQIDDIKQSMRGLSSAPSSSSGAAPSAGGGSSPPAVSGGGRPPANNDPLGIRR